MIYFYLLPFMGIFATAQLFSIDPTPGDSFQADEVIERIELVLGQSMLP